MLEDVSDVLISKSIIDGNGGESIQTCGDITDSPLLSVLREDAEHLQLLSLRLAEEFLYDDGTAYLMRPI